MQAPKLPAQFSLFRQRPLKGFDYAPRYYDPKEEARKERRRLNDATTKGSSLDRDALRVRLRHSWHREGSRRSSSMRFMLLLGLFAALAFAVLRLLRLTEHL